MERARYLAFVPITWGETINKFKVEIEHDAELTSEKLESIKRAALDYVASRGQTYVDSMPVEVYRKQEK